MFFFFVFVFVHVSLIERMYRLVTFAKIHRVGAPAQVVKTQKCVFAGVGIGVGAGCHGFLNLCLSL
jgi:hypothetical protein